MVSKLLAAKLFYNGFVRRPGFDGWAKKKKVGTGLWDVGPFSECQTYYDLPLDGMQAPMD
jgi:hypothetical protein